MGEYCAQCGSPIPAELQSVGSESHPCPNCGAQRRNFKLEADPGTYVISGSEIQYEYKTYPEALLEETERLIDEGRFNLAIIVCHMACEVATERAFSKIFEEKNINYLKEAIMDMLSGFNLGNNKIRRLYTALTGDEIQKENFWQKFKKSTTRRNEIVHRGKIFEKSEAEESFEATSELINHLLRYFKSPDFAAH